MQVTYVTTLVIIIAVQFSKLVSLHSVDTED